MDEFKLTDDAERFFLNECLDQDETVPTKKMESIFDQALTMGSDEFAQYFETKVNSRSAFNSVLNVPRKV